MSEHKGAIRAEVKSTDRGEITVVFSTLNVVDKHGDVTLSGAFTDGQKVKISAYGHESWFGALPVGRGVIRESGNEAIMDGKFFLDTAAGADTFRVVKNLGELQQWSFGFEILDHSYGEHGDRNVRFLKSLDVFEVSPVLRGAGNNTRTVSAKRDGLSDQDRAFVRRIGQKLTIREIERKYRNA